MQRSAVQPNNYDEPANGAMMNCPAIQSAFMTPKVQISQVEFLPIADIAPEYQQSLRQKVTTAPTAKLTKRGEGKWNKGKSNN